MLIRGFHFRFYQILLTAALFCPLTGVLYAQQQPDSLAPVPVVLKQPVSFFRLSPVPLAQAPVVSIQVTQVKTEVVRKEDGRYLLGAKAFGIALQPETELSLTELSALTLKDAMRENARSLVREAQNRQEAARGLLDFKIAIPGGSKSAFTTIFGKPEVNLSVTGRANMSIGASVVNDKSLNVVQRTTRVDPQFNQNLQLNIQGTIGDKLSIRTDWDTERDFDYQNRLNIVYEGYEDEILKRVELGNVSMETGNSLVRGGGALFGVKSTAQIGALKLMGVLSQKQGNSNTDTYKAGSKEQAIRKKPAEYEADRHFFMDFYLAQQFEEALAQPGQIVLPLANINQVRVYRRITTSSLNNDGVRAVALADMGTVPARLNEFAPPDNRYDRFSDALLNSVRNKENITAQDLGVAEEDFVSDIFQELEPGEDYIVNPTLGFISFRTPLASNQTIGISFQYTQGTDVVQVGELRPVGAQQTVFLKMIRPGIPSPSHQLWPLSMRNIYSVGATELTPDGTKIQLVYTGSNPERDFLPDVSASRNLMQDLGLDRVGPNNQPTPDNTIDFGITFSGDQGLIMFPYLEPFGSRISRLIDASSSTAKDELKQRYVFSRLYTLLPAEAQNQPANALYEITGSVKGGIQSTIQLGFSLVEGSVKVYANGTALIEGADFEVDYSMGFVRIVNESYLQPTYAISIEYENNNLIQIQQTTLAGMRAEYEVNENLKFGSTLFRYKELPQTDKIRVGEEPMNNTVIGLDGSGKFDAPWLTRFIDRIPLLQTKEPSSITFAGEFAQLRPNVARTPAVQRKIDDGSLFRDETRGVSFIDDFEGVENNVSLMNAFRWNMAAAPAGVPGHDGGFDNGTTFPSTFDDRIARNNLRAQMSWYVLPIMNTDVRLGPESEPLRVDQIFNRNVAANDNFLRTLDFYYNPTARGPYNYNQNLRNLLENEPQRTWAGVTTTMPQGSENLTVNNIEFIEFWVQFVLPDGRSPEVPDLDAYNGRLLIDIGQISEDVIPNSQLNSEDALSEQKRKVLDGVGLSYIQGLAAVQRDGAFAENSRELEDVGLDGVANAITNGADDERTLFKPFVDRMRIQYADRPDQIKAIERDPSNDDYVFWNGDAADSLGDRLHQRFYRFLGYHEGNSRPGSQATNRPDTEGLQSNITQTTNRYYQYEMNLNPADTTSLRPGRNYIVDRVAYTSRSGGASRFHQKFYQIRIPIREWKRRVGGIADFTSITHIRMWLTGYQKPFTMRFASFEFVGSQWRKATEAYTESPLIPFKVSTVNREENLNRRPVPYRTPLGAITPINRGQQALIGNEQALVLQVEDMPRGETRFISRTFTNINTGSGGGNSSGLNLLNYRNMRMFVHGEGYARRQDAEVVIRMGNDLTSDYYEYRQPVTPSDPDFPYYFDDATNDRQSSAEREQDDEAIWRPGENSINIPLSVFNILKQKRNSLGISDTATYVQEVAALLPGLGGIAPGARVAIKGDAPTLSKISVIALGIRNPAVTTSSGALDPEYGTAFLTGQFWLNELRVSGYDNRNGWKAAARSTVKMADFAVVNATYNESTEGYEGIQSKLGTRQRFNDRNVDLNGQVNLHKLIPDRYGWSMPLSLVYRNSYQQNVFMSLEPDIRWTDYQGAVSSREDLTPDQKRDILSAKQEEIERVREEFGFGLANVGKQFSKSPFLQATIDNVRLSANYNVSDERSPQSLRNFAWRYDGTASYNLTFKKHEFFQPFSFLEGVPVLRHLDAIRFTPKPTSITASANINRQYSENTVRVFGNQTPRVQPTHNMTAGTQFGLGFNPMPSISLNYSNATAFNMANVSRDTTIRRTGADSARIDLLSTPETIQRLLTDPSAKAQRNGYGEKWSLGWRPRISDVKQLKWMSYSFSYAGGFDWVNADQRSLVPGESKRLGSTISNSGSYTHTMRLGVDDLLKMIPVYAAALEADRKETREREVAAKKLRDERLKKAADAKKAREEALKNKGKGQEPPAAPSQAPPPQAGGPPAGNTTNRPSAGGAPSRQPARIQRTPAAGDQPAAPVATPAQAGAQPQTVRPGTPGKTAPAPAGAGTGTGKETEARKNAAANAGPLRYYARKALINATSFKAVDLTYTQRTTVSQAGYRGNAPLYYMHASDENTVSPDWGFRTGLNSRLDAMNLLIQPRQQITASASRTDNLTARTQFTPLKNMNVDLSWNVEWGDRSGRVFTMDTSRTISGTTNRNGSFSTTTTAFGPGYRNLFERQLVTAFGDIVGDSLIDRRGDNDGRSVLEPITLHEDFRRAYMGRAGRYNPGRYGFGALPLPNWNITYSGVEAAFPWLQNYITRMSLTHSYRGRYRAGYVFNPNASQTRQPSRAGDFGYIMPLADHTPDQSQIESAFAPLLGLNISWRNQMRTTFDFEQSRRMSFSYSSSAITENLSRGVRFSMNYEKRGFKLPGMKKLQNTVTGTLNFSYAQEIAQRFQLDNDLKRALTRTDPAFIEKNPKIATITPYNPTGTDRIQGSAVIGYQFSSMIQANFEYRYTHILPRSSNAFERITHDILFNISVAIRSN